MAEHFFTDDAIAARLAQNSAGRPLARVLADNATKEAASRQRRAKAARARPLNPVDITTWHEVEDLTPRLKERLRLGEWRAAHIRKQGDRGKWKAHEGVLETVPPGASFGYPDWFAIPERYPDTALWIELKAEKAHPMPTQAEWLLLLAKAGQEVYVWHPRHFVGTPSYRDVAFQRLCQSAMCQIREAHEPTAGCVYSVWQKTLIYLCSSRVWASMTVEQVACL